MSLSDATTLEEQLSQLLADCDEALAGGRPASSLALPSIPTELQARLERGVAWCDKVRRLMSAPDPPPAATTVTRLGRFDIRRELGRGGFGIVFLAFDPKLGREVAVKVPRPEVLVLPELRARFEQEARAAAGLDHPNLVPVYEAGEEGGICYIASAYCPGITLSAWLKQQTEPVPVGLAARLIETLAEAVAHAHQRGVLHRDLKPGNIMVETAALSPKITDFGMAKVLDAGVDASDADHTRTGAILGTPSYMAPEQAGGEARTRGPSPDIYALGAILYELLTGRPPFRGDTALDTLLLVRTQEPVPPARLRPSVPRDLETICLKCLHKDPRQRYPKAQSLADDLARYRARRPIEARRVGALWRLLLWCRRNPALALTLAVASTVIVGGAGISVQQIAAERDRYRVERDRAQLQAADFALDRGLGLCEKGEAGIGLLWMARALTLAPRDAEDLRHAIRANLAAWEHQVGRQQFLLPHPDRVWAVTASPDGRVVVTGCEDANTRVWDTATRATLHTFGHQRGVRVVALSRDGRAVLAGGPATSAQLWSLQTGHGVPVPHPGDLRLADFSPDSTTALTSGADGTTRLWAIPTGTPIKSYPYLALAFRWRDGLSLTPGRDTTARFLAASTAQPVGASLAHQGFVSVSAFSPDGRTVATGSDDNSARLWETATGKPLSPPLPHGDPIGSVAFSADSRTILTGSADHTARLWSVPVGQPLGAPLRHPDRVTGVAFAQTGHTVVTGCIDHYARLWQLPRSPEAMPALRHDHAVCCLAVSPDGATLLTGTGPAGFAFPGSAQCFEVITGRLRASPRPHPAPVRAAAFHPDGRTVVTASWDDTLVFWDAATGKTIGPTLPHHGNQFTFAVFSADGKTLLTGTMTEPHARWWDVATGAPAGPLLRHDAHWVRTAAFSADGRLIVTGGADRTARLWHAATGASFGPPLVHSGDVGAVAISRDGKLVVTGSDNKRAQLWDVATSRPIGAPLEHEGTVRAVAFSPDGRLVLTASLDKTARLWDTATRKPVGPAMHHDDGIETAAFTPDGRMAITGSRDRTVRFWEVTEAVQGDDEAVMRWVEFITGMELEGDGAFRVLNAAEWSARPPPMRY